jgi:hypothetical protein
MPADFEYEKGFIDDPPRRPLRQTPYVEPEGLFVNALRNNSVSNSPKGGSRRVKNNLYLPISDQYVVADETNQAPASTSVFASKAEALQVLKEVKATPNFRNRSFTVRPSMETVVQ